MKTGTKMSNASERIKGYCTDVTQAQWEELVRVADEVGVDVSHVKGGNTLAAVDVMGVLCRWHSLKTKTLIPFPDFLAKLRGVEEWTPKAGEMVEVSHNGEAWVTREFITKSKGRFIVWSNAGEAVDFTLCRPVLPTITRSEAEQKLGKRIID